MKTALILLTLLLATALHAGDTEPVGPPWTRDFMKAHAEALGAGKPIFLYFTKTYCPHCVPVEKNLLPNEKLKPVHGDLAWVFVYNDFKGGEADLATDRVRARFSISTWPNLLLVDPNTLEVIGDTGRTVETFLPAAAKAKGGSQAG
jgi:thiol-disulfide isomerase/thioredoxin